MPEKHNKILDDVLNIFVGQKIKLTVVQYYGMILMDAAVYLSCYGKNASMYLHAKQLQHLTHSHEPIERTVQVYDIN